MSRIRETELFIEIAGISRTLDAHMHGGITLSTAEQQKLIVARQKAQEELVRIGANEK